MKTRLSHQQTGFTLIELVIVITILGVLAAAAIPRYIAIQGQARTAKAQALYGGLKSAANLARSACAVDIAGLTKPSTCTRVGGTVLMDGTAVTMVNQYPDASESGILAAMQLNDASDGVVLTVNGTAVDIEIVGGDSATCRVTYNQAGRGPTAPVITPVTSGC
jgi:MSHA pilin protein MshA